MSDLPPNRTVPLVIAHRGASADAPENTAAAFREAWRQGADGVECDIHLTGDGHLVCCHDENTLRTTGESLRIADATLRELQSLDAGGWKGGRWRGERIPELRELLCARPPHGVLFIEVKSDPGTVPPLVELLARTGTPVHCVTLISFEAPVVRAWRKAVPQGRGCLLLEAVQHGITIENPGGNGLLQRIADAGADGGDLEYTDGIGPETVKRMRAASRELHVWTVNAAAAVRRCAFLGVNSITTDVPGVAAAECRVISS